MSKVMDPLGSWYRSMAICTKMLIAVICESMLISAPMYGHIAVRMGVPDVNTKKRSTCTTVSISIKVIAFCSKRIDNEMYFCFENSFPGGYSLFE